MSYSHLTLIQENIDLFRQGRQDKRGVRKVDARQHGVKLQNNFTKVNNDFHTTKKIGEDFIFRIVRDSDKPINYTKLGLILMAETHKNISIVRVQDEHALLSHLSSFTEEKIAKTNIVNYSDFANIEEFAFQTPEEKKGPLLNDVEVKNYENYTLDVQLYTSDESLKELHQKVASFKTYLSDFDVKFLDDFILQNLVMLKITIQGKFIDRLLEHKNVYVVDIPQNSTYDIKGAYERGLETFPNVSLPSKDAPYIGVIDSGILTTHPLLKGSIADSVAFGNLNSAFDENGHGTMVAGIIQYGDVYSTLHNHNESNSVSLPFNLLNGRVTNRENSFPDDRIVASVVKEAIEEFKTNYDCNIFNVSLGDSRFPYTSNAKMDPWSYVLDKLNHEYNLAIVVSAGNYNPAYNNEAILDNYLHYLLSDEDAALIPPSLAISCLTVGSTAKDDVPYSDSKKLSHVAISKKNAVSPFTRVGLGYSKVIKPETVAFGGNYSLNVQTKRINDSDRNLGIFSTSLFNSSRGAWFETRPGTSFSAPYITHLLGKIKKELPEAKGNLLRALLINTCNDNTTTKLLVQEKYEAIDKPATLKVKEKRLQGYGEVRENYLTKSTDNYVTMYFEGEIGINKVNVFEVPIPDEIFEKKGKSKIHISLAYNPPCRDSRIDYTGVKMSYQLYRGLNLEEVVKYTCKPDEGEFEKDKLPKDKEKCKCKLAPSMTDASKGTLIRTTHQITNNNKSRDSYGDTYYLVVKCQERWYKGPKLQPYAIVVSIEHEDDSAQLYIPIQQKVEARIRTQARARV
ncbi:S8 family peptidase [Priestia aryabhattai]